MPSPRPEPPDLALETLLATLYLPPLNPEDLWLGLTPKPPEPRSITLTFNQGPLPTPLHTISRERAERNKNYHFLNVAIDNLRAATRRMAWLHRSCTLPLPNPADPEDTYLRQLDSGSLPARLLSRLKQAAAGTNPNLTNHEPNLSNPRLLPLGLYDHYRQELRRLQEHRLELILLLEPMLAAHAELPPRQDFPREQSREQLRKLILMECNFKPSPTLKKFFASQPPEPPQGWISRMLQGDKLPGQRTTALYYAASHAARKLAEQSLSDPDTRPQSHRPQRQQRLKSP